MQIKKMQADNLMTGDKIRYKIGNRHAFALVLSRGDIFEGMITVKASTPDFGEVEWSFADGSEIEVLHSY